MARKSSGPLRLDRSATSMHRHRERVGLAFDAWLRADPMTAFEAWSVLLDAVRRTRAAGLTRQWVGAAIADRRALEPRQLDLRGHVQ